MPEANLKGHESAEVPKSVESDRHHDPFTGHRMPEVNGVSNNDSEKMRNRVTGEGHAVVGVDANHSSNGSQHLPPLELSDLAFEAIATGMLNRLDVNNDGLVTKSELKDFIDHPTKFDKQSTRDAVQLMYQNYDFLRELSVLPGMGAIEHSRGINSLGIHRGHLLADGALIVRNDQPVPTTPGYSTPFFGHGKDLPRQVKPLHK